MNAKLCVFVSSVQKKLEDESLIVYLRPLAAKTISLPPITVLNQHFMNALPISNGSGCSASSRTWSGWKIRPTRRSRSAERKG
jgi:hypothetical protein